LKTPKLFSVSDSRLLNLSYPKDFYTAQVNLKSIAVVGGLIERFFLGIPGGEEGNRTQNIPAVSGRPRTPWYLLRNAHLRDLLQ
jgi:hypothetical protein